MVKCRDDFKKIFGCKVYRFYKTRIVYNRPDIPYREHTFCLNRYNLEYYIRLARESNGTMSVRVVEVENFRPPLTPIYVYKILAVASKYGVTGFDFKAKDFLLNVYKTLVNHYKETKDENFRNDINEVLK